MTWRTGRKPIRLTPTSIDVTPAVTVLLLQIPHREMSLISATTNRKNIVAVYVSFQSLPEVVNRHGQARNWSENPSQRHAPQG